ncbi:lycopene beta-cyclase CrtY [Falsirhodobacter halotolerans]|uniref:lycopene beta-cyclase CrtY n=1 Tax=Falsirhodobacter halotolerans TaxID=1146892 RepID=UPI001FD0C721|nr:lycopene beta-cyclase CrtY [Falsirhodobacter halotolerans]MCJ8138929.1 lycopene beta-cyclase CrtY [Falsirhodobacter halotolerans]
MDTDIAIAGAGLAAALTALRLRALPDAPRVTLIDSATPFVGRTWSFHDDDVTGDDLRWISPAIAARWQGQDVRFPDYRRTLDSGYATIRPETMARAVADCGVRIVQGQVTTLAADHLTVDGTALRAPLVIDARGAAPHPALRVAWQKFLGQEVALTAPHGLTRPVIMDATVDQLDGYRFVYLLPFSPTRLLIEDTRYSDGPEVDAKAFRAGIAAYAQGQGWTIADVLAEETSSLPLALDYDAARFWADAALPRIGMRAAQFHPVTGYSLPDAVRTANVVARHWHEGSEALARHLTSDALTRARRQGFYRMLNRMLFRAADPAQRRHVMQRFYTLPEPLIARFYAGRTTPADMARILIGKPPVSIPRALRALPRRTLP